MNEENQPREADVQLYTKEGVLVTAQPSEVDDLIEFCGYTRVPEVAPPGHLPPAIRQEEERPEPVTVDNVDTFETSELAITTNRDLINNARLDNDEENSR